MTSAPRQLFIAGLLAALGLAAVAQTPPGPPGPSTGTPEPGADRGPHGGPGPRGPARMKQLHAQHMAQLKQKLKLAPEQEGAWATWSAAMQPPADRPPRPDREAFARMTTPERIDRMRELRGQRIAEMDRRMDATKAFYATLGPQQRQTFDAESHRLLRRRHGMGPRRN